MVILGVRLDDDEYSNNEYCNNSNNKHNEEYIDFRIYPLSISWQEVENENSIACILYLLI